MIGETLKKLRGIYGYTAKELSELLGISRSYLSEIENGDKQPTYRLLEKYSEILDIKLSSLMLLAEGYNEADSKTSERALTARLMEKAIGLLARDSDER